MGQEGIVVVDGIGDVVVKSVSRHRSAESSLVGILTRNELEDGRGVTHMNKDLIASAPTEVYYSVFSR